MFRDNRRFQQGASVYSCSLCGRRTRETGSGESQLEMCVDCFNLCSYDNEHNDEGSKPDAKQAARYQAWLDNIAEHGGNAAAVRSFCSYAFPKGEA